MAGSDGTINTGGTVVAIAGTGVRGYNGDNIAANAAELANPAGLAFDTNGNLFISDSGNGRVREVTANGGAVSGGSVIQTVAGTGVQGNNGVGGQASATQLNSPISLAVDSTGDLYIADYGNSRVLEVNASTDIVSTVISGYYVQGVAVDSAGDLFAGSNAGVVLEKPAGSSFVTAIAGMQGANGYDGDGSSLATNLAIPTGVAVDSAGNLFIADTGNALVRELSLPVFIVTPPPPDVWNGTGDWNTDLSDWSLGAAPQVVRTWRFRAARSPTRVGPTRSPQSPSIPAPR